MKPDYQIFDWLEKRWRTSELVKITDQDIRRGEENINKLHAQNVQMYERAKRERQRASDTFRREHPRAKVPAELERYITKPPDLHTPWKNLLRRRKTALQHEQDKNARCAANAERRQREQVKRREKRREDFLNNMSAGRYHAMRKREVETRRLITEQAAALGIELHERATDKRLNELLATMNLL